jgi:hypothetical protein
VRTFIRIVLAAAFIAGVAGGLRAAGEYPLTLVADARAKNETTTINTKVTIYVDRLMEESRRKRVSDALRFSGYANALTALRALPPIGKIDLEKRSVQIKYAVETQDEKGRHLVLVADRPLFFLGSQKSSAGYELTIAELHIDAQGNVTGTMMGAARVKPTGEGGVGVGDFGDVKVELTARVGRP